MSISAKSERASLAPRPLSLGHTLTLLTAIRHGCVFPSHHRKVPSPRGVGSGEEFEWGKSSPHRCQRRWYCWEDHWHKLSHHSNTMITIPVRHWSYLHTSVHKSVYLVEIYCFIIILFHCTEAWFVVVWWSCPVCLNVLQDIICFHGCNFIDKNQSFY